MTANRLDEVGKTYAGVKTGTKADHDLTVSSSNGVAQNRKFTVINESGLYNVILRSDKPQAAKFKKWVTPYV
jgi:prophage antirepressor-like protein